MTQVVQVFRNFRMSSERSLQCVHPSELYPSLLFRLAQPKRKTVIPPHGVTRVLRAFLRPCWRLGLFRLGLFRPFVTAGSPSFPVFGGPCRPITEGWQRVEQRTPRRNGRLLHDDFRRILHSPTKASREGPCEHSRRCLLSDLQLVVWQATESLFMTLPPFS